MRTARQETYTLRRNGGVTSPDRIPIAEMGTRFRSTTPRVCAVSSRASRAEKCPAAGARDPANAEARVTMRETDTCRAKPFSRVLFCFRFLGFHFFSFVKWKYKSQEKESSKRKRSAFHVRRARVIAFWVGTGEDKSKGPSTVDLTRMLTELNTTTEAFHRVSGVFIDPPSEHLVSFRRALLIICVHAHPPPLLRTSVRPWVWRRHASASGVA